MAFLAKWLVREQFIKVIGVSREKCKEGQRGADNNWIRNVGIMLRNNNGQKN